MFLWTLIFSYIDE